ncbi:MAG: hypothetical protein A2Y94_13955 [Caldithrix sp. RBG_13_44_9]|nr:MAG: hypothetical protein A2Y94_13955 [Caldithrix sp. RBG_13_44_9]
MARRYGKYLFDRDLIDDLRHPIRREVLIKTLELKTENEIRFEGSLKVFGKFSEALRNWLDIGLLTVIRSIPAFDKVHAREKNKIQSIFGTDWNKYKGKGKKGRELIVGKNKFRVVREIDDSDRQIKGNWKDFN